MTDTNDRERGTGPDRAEGGAGNALRVAMVRVDDPHHATRGTPGIGGDVRMRTKPGVRGYPEPRPGVREIAPLVRDAAAASGAQRPVVVDASGSAGALAAVAREAGDVDVRVLEPSAAARACAEERHDATGVRVAAGWIWDAPAGAADQVLLLPPADRGSARVHAELAGAAYALKPEGTAWIALHKDRGGKRYLKDALRWFGEVDTVCRSKGWRMGMLRKPVASDMLRDAVGWIEFEANGTSFAALPGVFAAGKLDPGTRVLLDVLERSGAAPVAAGSRVLDLGCGYGVLALWAARAGADVTAVDDDLTAVRSTERNADRQGEDLRALHSDLDAALAGDERFDLVLCNPPFHIGKEVRLDLSQAFVRAANRRLLPGGRMWLVANRALPYERYLEGWAGVETLAQEGGFKVVRATR